MDELVTTRLLLHPLTLAESARVAACTPAPDDRWALGKPDEGDAAAARLRLDDCGASGASWPFGAYEIRRREDGGAVGTIRSQAAPDASGRVTVGYGLVPAARGNGYATEALCALLGFAHACGVRGVWGDAELENLASRRVMTAAGMRFVREDTRLRYCGISRPDSAA